jgi:hypothetical protein
VRIKTAFTMDVTVEGDKLPRDQLVEAIELWLDEAGGEFGDFIIDYVPEEYSIDHLTVDVSGIRIG